MAILGKWIFSSGGSGGGQLPKGLLCPIFADNCMKMKEFGLGGGRINGALLDPPLFSNLVFIRNEMLQSDIQTKNNYTTRRHSSIP